MKLSKFKYVILDLDGTLLDTSEGILKAVEYTLENLGIVKPDRDVLRKFIGPPIEQSFKRYCMLDEKQAKDAAGVFRNYYMNETLLMAKPYDGIFELCNELKKTGCKLAVATYKREKYAIELLRHFNFHQYMDVMHGSDEEGKLSKADIINLCVKELGAQKEATVLVGDTFHDLNGAKDACIKFVGVTYGFGFVVGEKIDNACCYGVVDSAMELLK